jgi:hypothetical protein
MIQTLLAEERYRQLRDQVVGRSGVAELSAASI